MENFGLLVIFWYGILHAFGPDHLMVIADFSIGKSKKKTFFITMAFAFGHGLMLFVFAKLLESYHINETILSYADTISASVILFMGIYLLYLVYSKKINLKTHTHEGKEHIHIWFGKEHEHSKKDTLSVFTLGALMGIGGVRGMLVTLGLLQGNTIDLSVVFVFILGVSVVFLSLGVVVLYVNQNFLKNIQNVRKVFATTGIISVIVGFAMLS